MGRNLNKKLELGSVAKTTDGRDPRTQTYRENGREYQNYRRYQYLYPCDPVSPRKVI